MRDNPQRRTAIIWGIITSVAIFAVFAPHIFGMDGMGGGFAISTVSVIVAITGIIVCIIYIRRADALEKLLNGENLLAHWTYTPEEWQRYTDQEFSTQRKEKWALFFVIAIISLVVGIAFFIFDPKAGLWVFVSMLALVALIAFMAWFSAWQNLRLNKKYPGEAYISNDAVYLNRQFHTWKGFGARLESVSLVNNGGQQMLSFKYSVPSRNGRQRQTVRVPVPRGLEKASAKIANDINLYKESGHKR